MIKQIGFAAASLLLATSVASAQSLNQMAQGVINSSGKTCQGISMLKPMGKDNTGTAYVAAACTDGSRHVLKIEPNAKNFKYVSSCSIWKSSGGPDCF
jgi:hypothetical protein